MQPQIFVTAVIGYTLLMMNQTTSWADGAYRGQLVIWDVTHWLTLVAQLLRKQSHDAPPARVIDALSLAQALGALRNLRYLGINELNQATLTTLAHGDEKVMALIHEKMVVGRDPLIQAGQSPNLISTVDANVIYRRFDDASIATIGRLH